MTREEFINWLDDRYALTKTDIYELGQLYDEVTKPQRINVEGIKGNQGETFHNLSNSSNAGKDLKGGEE